MKKRIFTAVLSLFYFLCSFFFSPWRAAPTIANAAAEASLDLATVGGYACILSDSAYFYASRDERRGLFLIPKTYFVKILSIEPDFCRVEYLYDDEYAQKLTGYAKTDDLTFVDYTPASPYLYHLFEVRYTIDGAFSDDDAFLNQITVTCAYYGDYRIGSETYCYVKRGDSFGYIPKPATLTYAENPEYNDRLSAPAPDNPASDTQSGGMSPAQIAILVALCLLVPVLAALILKPNKRPVYDPDQE